MMMKKIVKVLTDRGEDEKIFPPIHWDFILSIFV